MTVSKTLRELADLIGAELQGPPDLLITGVGPLDGAGPGMLSFLANPKYQTQLATTRAAAVIMAPGVAWSGPRLVTPDPYLAFTRVVQVFAPVVPLPAAGVHPSAVVHPSARIAASAAIGPHCVVGAGSEIGENTVLVAQVFVGDQVRIGRNGLLYPQVVVRERVQIGDQVILHPGVVLGADGFGFAPQGPGYQKIPQIGTVVIEDEVEIGANSTVDRAALGETRIGKGSKLDNLVMVAHNVIIGPHCAIAAQTGISGSARLGEHVTLGGQTGVAGHITVGDHVVAGGQTGIQGDIEPKTFIFGMPARPYHQTMRQMAEVARLHLLRKRVEALERRLKELESK